MHANGNMSVNRLESKFTIFYYVSTSCMLQKQRPGDDLRSSLQLWYSIAYCMQVVNFTCTSYSMSKSELELCEVTILHDILSYSLLKGRICNCFEHCNAKYTTQIFIALW